MAGAAGHFGYLWNRTQVETCLQNLADAHPAGLWRVRLLLDWQGQPVAQAFAMEPSPPRVQLALANTAMEDADSEFIRFKTTRRAHYDAFAPTLPEVFDSLLWNPRGELTECTRGNIALLLDGRWVTPPLTSGLLGGVGRAHYLAGGRLTEAVVRVGDLPRASGLAFINSLRGWIDADLI
jgi:para-aminobenzoate synthetase/4-amino-4-deoxychorismate lyase